MIIASPIGFNRKAGSSGPAAGTVVIGAVSTTTTAASYSLQLGYVASNASASTAVATWTEAAETTTISKLAVRFRDNNPYNIKLLLYNSSNAFVAETGAFTCIDDFNWKTVELSFASPPTITKGQGYRLGIIFQGNYAAIMGSGGTSAVNRSGAGTAGQYDTPPATLGTANTYSTDGPIPIWAIV